jgi:50S ribosomal subunit-associated GTPase HflX
VRAVLAEIGADERPMLEVYNKIDVVNEPPASTAAHTANPLRSG